MKLRNLTNNDILDTLSISSYERGRKYYKEGRVKETYYQGNTLFGSVKGSRLYAQTIIFDGDGIKGACTCPMQRNCKHVAAVLFQVSQSNQKLIANKNAKKSKIIDAKIIEEDLTIPEITYSLPAQTVQWLEEITEILDPKQETQKKRNTQQKGVAYVLKLDGSKRPRIVALNAAYKKNGDYGKQTKPIDLNNFSLRYGSKHIDVDSFNIFHRLMRACNEYCFAGDGFIIDSEKDSNLLNDVIATGKCHWRSMDEPMLKLGETKQAKIEWEILSDAVQRPICKTNSEDDHIMLSPSPWYVCTKTHTIGQLSFDDISDTLASNILQAPDLEPEAAEHIHDKLRNISNDIAVPTPTKFKEAISKSFDPAPCLHLSGEDISDTYGNFTNVMELPIATLQFKYGKDIVNWTSYKKQQTTTDGDTLIRYNRDFPKEKSFTKTFLRKHKFEEIVESQHFYFCARKFPGATMPVFRASKAHDKKLEQNWLSFVTNGIPKLREEGWQITIDPSFPYNFAYPDDNEWYANLDESSGIDWFSFELGVKVDGEELNLLPILLQSLNNHTFDFGSEWDKHDFGDEQLYFVMEDGRRLVLPTKRVYKIVHFLKDLYSFQSLDENGKVRISKIEIADLDELNNVMEGLKLRWFGGEKLRKLAEKMKNFKGITAVTPPKNFKAELRDYQKDGLSWMQFLREYGLAGILADDMGLGKTIQTLAHIMCEKNQKRLTKPVLVVSPTSVLVNWRSEAERFAPKLKVLVLHGSDRKNYFKAIQKHDVVLTTYPLLSRDKDILLAEEFHTVVLDEAQYIKNIRNQNTQIACQLKAQHRLCLTGTPVENHLGELWSQFNFLLPGFLGDQSQFRKFFRTPIEKQLDRDRNAALVRRIKPFILRRTKDEVVVELPPKTEIIRTVELDKTQRDLYETVRVSMHKKVRDEIAKKGLERSHIIVLDALLKLRQICCDPKLLKLDAAKNVNESAKLELLMEMLPNLIEDGRKILLFSQFTSMIKIIEKRIEKLGIEYVKLTGQTKDRATPIKAFQNGDVPLFIISLKSGGTGLNLTAADTVIHYDPWWNPAVENQATDRAHRIGQDKPVFVYKLLTSNTVEEKILEMQKKKRALAESIFNPENQSKGKLTTDDIAALFEPIEE